MKLHRLFLFFLPLAWLSYARAQDTELPPVTFGGGLNVKQAASDIGETESPDLQNMVNDVFGASFKRNGGQRYISQAISSNPITSLYRAYASTGTTYVKALFATTKDSIYVSSFDVNPQWVQIASFTYPNQHWRFVIMNNKVIMTPESLQDPIFTYDLTISSMSKLLFSDISTNTINVRGKYPLVSKNYFLLGNCVDVSTTGLLASATYYNSRVYYSLLLQPSSFTYSRYLEVRTDDGEPIMGVSELNGFVHIWKETTISELTFTILNLLNLGGDQALANKVLGFGLFAPRTLASTGDGYIFGSKDGLRFWDGGRTTRLSLDQSSRPLDEKISPIINRAIKAGTWKNAVGIYYPKKHWYVLSLEDPNIQPHGKNNLTLVFDFINAAWFPFNWKAESFAIEDGIGDNGQLMMGDSTDGYVYAVDLDNAPNDPRKELPIDTMDSTATWFRSSSDIQNVIEGTGAVRMGLFGTTFYSSTTLMRIINVGNWTDGTAVTKSDKLAFKVFVTTMGNLTSLRCDLEVNDIKGDFDANFTSVTISSAALTHSDTVWTNVEIALSSFPIRPDWISLDSETVPFARCLTFYGIRFVSTGVAVTSVTIDDVRLVQATENPLNAYRFTKQFNFGTSMPKQFRQVILNRELPNDSSFSIDVFTDFGNLAKRIPTSGGFPKEIFVAGYGGTNTITKLNSVDFTPLDSTSSLSSDAFDYRYIRADKNFIYAADKSNDILYKIDRTSLNVVLAKVGSFGSGTTNFNTIHEMDVDENYVYITDVNNQRIQVRNKSNLGLVTIFGTLGTGATSYHEPVGICVDKNYIYVANEGNEELAKVSKSSFTKIITIPVNLNTVGEMTLACDENYVYDAYNSQSNADLAYQDVILEKRSKDNLGILNSIVVRPLNSVAISTYGVKGDMGQSDDYLYVTFTDDISDNGNYYIQKRLKSDFSIVREQKSQSTHYTVAGNSGSFTPKRKNQVEDLNAEGSYLQLKYSESGLDNSMKLFNQAFLIVPEGTQELGGSH